MPITSGRPGIASLEDAFAAVDMEVAFELFALRAVALEAPLHQHRPDSFLKERHSFRACSRSGSDRGQPQKRTSKAQ